MIRVAAHPATIDATPGHPIDLTLRIDNTASVATSFALRLVGIDPSWVTWPEATPVAAGATGPTMSIGANEAIELPVQITLPSGFPSGAQLIGIEAAIDGARPALGSLQVVVADIDGVRFSLSPASFRGGRSGRFRINVANRGREPITLDVSGRAAGDDPAELKFEFKPKQLTLRTDERARIRGRVTGKRPIVGAPRIRPMTIVAQSNSAPLHADARFTQRPLLSRRILRVFAIFIALSMWAGALVTAVRWSGGRSEQTAEDASAVIDEGGDTTETTLAPGESVMVDTDGDGVPDTEMIDADGDGKPDTAVGPDGLPIGEDGLPTGPVLSGQVTGIADRQDIVVSGRYVALAEAIAPDAGDDAVAAQGLKDGRRGKLYASGLTVDTDDPAKADRSTVTDENGFWKLAGLAEGNWELTFTKEGFGTRTLVVPVEEGVENEPIEIPMAAGDGSIGGIVSDESGPLGGALITVTDGAVTFTTTTPTDGDVGRWQIGGLSTPGTYLVTAEKRGFGTETTSVTLAPSGSDLSVAQTLVAGVGSISGIVNGGGEGIGGIVVTAASDTVTREVTTLTADPDVPEDETAGTFSMPQLPIPGDYTITITGDGWVPQTQLVQLDGNVVLEPFELQSTTASITGTVEGPEGKLDAVGITVSQDEPLVKTLSAAEPNKGAYEVVGLLPGTYTVTFERFGYETQSTIVELAVGDVTTVDMTLAATPEAAKSGDATVKGIVRNGITGQPITGVNVAFQGKTATTVEGGTFTLTGLAAGTGDLALTHAMYQTTARSVRLGVKAEVQVDVTMLPLGGLQGQVTDLTATPISGVSVTVAAQTGTTAVSVPAATTDANGEYSILQSFPTGSYVATFSKTGFGTQTREFEAAAGSNSVADIQLVELGTITGGLQEPGGGVGGFLSLSDVTVKVEKLVNGAVSGAPVFGPVVRSGSYTVSGLEAGSYRVTASKEFTPGVATIGTRDLLDLKLREVRDGGIVLNRGAAAVTGQVYFSTGTGRQGVNGATITAQIVTGYTILPTFPFVSPSLQNVSTTSVASGTLVDSDDDGAVDDVAPVDGFYVIDPQPVSGSIANYTIAATGFTTRIQAITSPTAGGSGDIVLIPNPKDIDGTIAVNPAVAGAQVVATLSSPVLSANVTHPTVTTGVAGTVAYSFADLAPGDYTVTFTSLDGADADSLPDYHSTTDTISLTNLSPESNSLGTTTLDRTSSLELVTRTNTAGGAFVQGTSVTLTALSGSTFSQTKIADSNGEVLFESLTARTYRVTASRTGFDTATSAAAATATMIADVVLAVNDQRIDGSAPVILLQRHPDVRVTVDGKRTNIAPDADSVADVVNATVTLTPLDGGASISLLHDVNGEYVATQVPPNSNGYRLDVTAPSHESYSATVSPAIAAGANRTIPVELSRFASLVVYLEKTIGATTDTYSDADNTAVPATITATPTAGGSTITLTKCVTATPVAPCSGDEGTWVANNVPNGTYAIAASASGFSGDTIEIPNVTAGATFTNLPGTGALELALTRFATLTVNVLKSGVATSASSVTATKGDGTVIPMTPTGNVGEFRVTSIATGTYTITVTKADHVTATLPGVQVDSGENEQEDVTVIDLPDASVQVTDAAAPTVSKTDATVTATPTGGGAPISFTLDDNATPADPDDDFYEALKVPTGTYTLSVSAPGFATDTSQTFQSTSLGTITGLVSPVQLSVAASINVEVRDPGTNLVDDALVVVRAIGGTNPTSRVRFTGDDGSGLAIFDEMTPTSGFLYRITVSKAGYETYVSTDLALTTGASLDHDVTLTPLAITTFALTSSAGGTVSGATVTAQPTSGLGGPVAAVQIGAGSYLFPGLAAGDYTIRVNAPNHGAYPLTTSFTLSALDTDDADVGVANGALVAGETRNYPLTLSAWPTQTVTVDSDPGAGSTPVSGAIVLATPTSGTGATVPLFETSTPGTYRSAPLSPLVAPGYTLTASLSGYTFDTTPIVQTGAVVAGTALGTTHNLDLLLNPTLTVDVESGFTTPDTLAAENGATVTLTPTAGSGAAVTLTRTTTAGRYISPRLVDGTTYTLSATLDGHTLQATVPGIAATAGGTLTDEDLVLLEHPTQSIEVERRANNVTTDLSGATVTATRDGGPTYTFSESATDGTYVSPPLEPGASYTITASFGSDALSTTRSTGVVTEGEELSDIASPTALLLEAVPTLTVNVLAGFDTDTDGNAGNDPDPIQANGTGSVVTASPTTGGEVVTLGELTGTPGRYTTNDLEAGLTYTIRASKAGHTLVASGTFTATLGAANGTVSQTLLRSPDLTVNVLAGTTGSFLAADANDATVTLTPNGGGTAIVLGPTGANGVYATTAVPPAVGAYTLTVSKPGYSTTTSTFTSSAGQQQLAATSVNLRRLPSVTISVASDSGGDLDDATVTATHNVTGAVVTFVPIGSGDYRAGSVPTGLYTFRAIAPNHDEAFANNQSVGTGVDSVTLGTITLPRHGSITVTVVSEIDDDASGPGDAADQTALATATVVATNTDTGVDYVVPPVPATAGTYILADVPDGDYTVAATASGHDGDDDAVAQAVDTTDNASFSLVLLKHPDLTVNVLAGLSGGTTLAQGSGSTVTLTPRDFTGPTITIVESGVAGVHTLLPVAPGGYTLTATKANHRSASVNVDVDAGVALATQSLELLRYPTVTVLVTDDSGALAGVTVSLTDEADGDRVVLTAGVAGTYSATFVPNATYTLRVEKTGYVSYVETGVVVSAGTTLAYDWPSGNVGAPEPDPVNLEEAATLTVTVRSGLDTLDGSDTLLDGATVTAVNTSTGETFPVPQVDGGAAGDYFVGNITAGNYTVEATAPNHDAAASVTVNSVVAGDEETATVFPLAWPTVTIDVDGVAGGGAATDLGGASVRATRAGVQIDFVESATTGTYVSAPLPPSATAYTITATKVGYTTENAATTVTSTAGTSISSPAAIALDQGTIIRVTVNSENDVDGADIDGDADDEDPTLAELTSATVTADGPGTADLTLNHVAGAVYEALATTAGTYVISVGAPGHTSKSGSGDGIADVVVALGAAAQTRTVNLEAEAGTVSGTVVDLLNAGINGVTVTATNGDVSFTTTTAGAGAAAGGYSFTTIEPGVWSLKFDKTDIAPLTISVTVGYGTVVDDGATVDVDVTLAPAGGSINGQVLSKAANLAVSSGNPASPLGGATVELRLSDGVASTAAGALQRTSPATVATSGAWWAFGGLDPGTYDLVFNAPAGFTDSIVDDVVVSGVIVTQSYTAVADEVSAVITTSLADGITDVNDVNVTLTNPALISPAETQESDGTTTFTVPYGTYTMTVSVPTGYASIDPISRTIIVLPTGTTNIDHRFSAIGTVSGTTMQNDDATATTLVGTYDETVSGVTVTVLNTTTGYRQEVTSGADGTYSASNVPVGTGYTVTFEKDGYVTDSNNGSFAVTVDSNLATTAGDVTQNGGLDKLASFVINVVDQVPAALAGASVSLFQNDVGTGVVSAYLGGTGITAINTTSFQVTGLDPTVADKDLHIRGTLAGYFQVVDSTITLIAGDNGTKTLELVQDADLTISTTGLAGAKDITITLNWTRLNVAASSGPHAFDNSNDPIVVNGLPAELDITAVKVQNDGASCTLTTGPGADVDGTFQLTAGSAAGANLLTYTCT